MAPIDASAEPAGAFAKRLVVFPSKFSVDIPRNFTAIGGPVSQLLLFWCVVSKSVGRWVLLHTSDEPSILLCGGGAGLLVPRWKS